APVRSGAAPGERTAPSGGATPKKTTAATASAAQGRGRPAWGRSVQRDLNLHPFDDGAASDVEVDLPAPRHVEPKVLHLEAAVPDRRAMDERVVGELLLGDGKADRAHDRRRGGAGAGRRARRV